MMRAMSRHGGYHELAAARAASLPLLVMVGLFSLTVNLLMLTGPLFMMQVYDRVLTSRSVPTLTALLLLVAFLFVLMGIVDLARNRIMIRVAASLHERLQARVFDAALRRARCDSSRDRAESGLHDLEAVFRLVAAPLLLALFDLPFAPLFLAAVFIMDPLLGWVALAGLVVLVLATLANQLASRTPLQRLVTGSQKAGRMARDYHDAGEVVAALGMERAAFARWQTAHDESITAAVQGFDRNAGFSAFSRSFRQFLQSALLAAGAWLVLKQQITPGAMIAASILMARALAPIEQVIGGWPSMQRAQFGWARLAALLGQTPPPEARTALPRPAAQLDVRRLVITPPGQASPTLRGIGFHLSPGQAVGVIGPSGAGKSTLARALIGAWPPTAGSTRLGGATLDQYSTDMLGRLIGYLPQQVTLFEGTIAENIARLAHAPDPAQVVAAAVAADAHEMILGLPQGYDTVITPEAGLSGGQMQRIGLARALYGDPLLLVLDEPNASLDSNGSDALNRAIRRAKARGAAVVVMTHRPTAMAECDLVLMLDAGVRRAFGRRDDVLRAALQDSAGARAGQRAGAA